MLYDVHPVGCVVMCVLQAGRRTVTGSKFRFFVSRLVSTLQSESQVRFVYTLRTNEDHHPRFVEPAVLERQINGTCHTQATVRGLGALLHTPLLPVCACGLHAVLRLLLHPMLFAALRLTETATATRQGLPHRFSLLEFYQRYILLGLDVMKRHDGYGSSADVWVVCEGPLCA